MSRELASGADQRAHLRAALHHGGLVEVVRLRSQDPIQAGDHGGGAVRELLLVIHEHHGVLAGLAGAREFDGQVPRRNAIARRERHHLFDADAVQQRSVLAAQILHGPFAVAPDQRQMLARESDIVGITQLVRAGAAERDAVAIQGYGGGFALQVTDDQFAGNDLLRAGGQGLSVTLLYSPVPEPLCSALCRPGLKITGGPDDRLQGRLYLTVGHNMVQNVCFSPIPKFHVRESLLAS